MVNIVSRCLEYPGGLTELMDAVKLYTGPDDPAFIEADEAARRLIEAVERAPRGVTELPVKPSAPAALLTELASRIQQLPIGASDSRLAVIAVDLEEIAAALANALKDTEDVALLEIELGDIQTLLGSFAGIPRPRVPDCVNCVRQASGFGPMATADGREKSIDAVAGGRGSCRRPGS